MVFGSTKVQKNPPKQTKTICWCHVIWQERHVLFFHVLFIKIESLAHLYQLALWVNTSSILNRAKQPDVQIVVDAIQPQFRNKAFISGVNTVINKSIQESLANNSLWPNPKPLFEHSSPKKVINSQLSLTSTHFLLSRNTIITQHKEGNGLVAN